MDFEVFPLVVPLLFPLSLLFPALLVKWRCRRRPFSWPAFWDFWQGQWLLPLGLSGLYLLFFLEIPSERGGPLGFGLGLLGALVLFFGASRAIWRGLRRTKREKKAELKERLGVQALFAMISLGSVATVFMVVEKGSTFGATTVWVFAATGLLLLILSAVATLVAILGRWVCYRRKQGIR